MSVRALLVAVVVTPAFVVGCAQTSSPTSPSASASLSVSSGVDGPATQSVTPVLARLNLVENLLVSANQQLGLFFVPPNPVVPPNPISPAWDLNTLNFYLKANAVLDGIPPNPVSPLSNALDAIIGQANITLDLIHTHVIPPNPIIPIVVDQANHTITVANSLKSCGVDVCGG